MNEEENIVLAHKKNLEGKIRNKKTSEKRREHLNEFFNGNYKRMKENVESIDFSQSEEFKKFAEIINKYDKEVEKFEADNNYKSQAKIKSSFYEEICCYMFSNLPRVKSREFGIFNKKIFVGFNINKDDKLELEKKDVDFCIGKKTKIIVKGNKKQSDIELEIIKPVIAIEVKTYTDATMFGEIKSTSLLLRNASPDAKTYVLMGENRIGDEHISAAKQIYINEMFVLREKKSAPMRAEVFESFYKEVSMAVEQYGKDKKSCQTGRLLNP